MGYSNADRMTTHLPQGQQNKHTGIVRFPDLRATSAVQLQLQGMMHTSPQMIAQRKTQASMQSLPTAQKQEVQSDITSVVQRANDQLVMGETVQRNGSDDEEWMEEDNDAPDGYMDPSDYYEEFGGSDHSELDGDVWVARIDNWPALWWRNPEEESVLALTGTRPGDIAALGGDDDGLTWHHCADYGGGTCTMQQVDSAQHSSWGHRGGAAQAGYAAGAD